MRTRIDSFFMGVAEFGLYGLAFFIPVSKPAVTLFSALLVFAFLARLPVRAQGIFDAPGLKRSCVFLLLFFCFCALSLSSSGPLLKKSLHAIFVRWLEGALIFLAAQDILADPRRRRNVILVFLTGAMLAVFDGITQRLWNLEFLAGRKLMPVRDHGRAVTGSYNHYNGFASYLVVALCLTLGLSFNSSLRKDKKTVAVLGLLTFALAACLLGTYSRSGWLGMAAGLTLMILLKRWKEIIPIILIFLLLLVFIPGLRERALFSFQPGGDMSRFKIWEAAWEMIKDAPWRGQGVGLFVPRFPASYIKDYSTPYAHNCYLQIWAEVGLFGLVSFLAFLGSVLRESLTSLRVAQDSLSRSVLLGLISGFSGFLVKIFFDVDLYAAQSAVLFWFALGLLSGFSKKTAK